VKNKIYAIIFIFYSTVLLASGPREHFQPLSMHTGIIPLKVSDFVNQRKHDFLRKVKETLPPCLQDVGDEALEASLKKDDGTIDYTLLSSQYLQLPDPDKEDSLPKVICCLENAEQKAKKIYNHYPDFASLLSLADVSAMFFFRSLLPSLKDLPDDLALLKLRDHLEKERILEEEVFISYNPVLQLALLSQDKGVKRQTRERIQKSLLLKMICQAGHCCFMAREYLEHHQEIPGDLQLPFRHMVSDFILKLLLSINYAETQYMREDEDGKKAFSYAVREIARRLELYSPQTYFNLKNAIFSLIENLPDKTEIEIGSDLQDVLQEINGIMTCGLLAEYITNYYSVPENFENDLDESKVLKFFTEKNPHFPTPIVKRLISDMHPFLRFFMAHYRDREVRSDEFQNQIDQRYTLPIDLYRNYVKDEEIRGAFLSQGMQLGSMILKDIQRIILDCETFYFDFDSLRDNLAIQEKKTVSMYLLFKCCRFDPPETMKDLQEKREEVFQQVKTWIEEENPYYQDLRQEIIKNWKMTLKG